MPIEVRLKPRDQFLGSDELRAEMIRRLADGPCSISELAAIEGSSIMIVLSLIDLPVPHRSRLVVELADGTDLMLGSRPL
jgi:hypothetical protein